MKISIKVANLLNDLQRAWNEFPGYILKSGKGIGAGMMKTVCQLTRWAKDRLRRSSESQDDETDPSNISFYLERNSANPFMGQS